MLWLCVMLHQIPISPTNALVLELKMFEKRKEKIRFLLLEWLQAQVWERWRVKFPQGSCDGTKEPVNALLSRNVKQDERESHDMLVFVRETIKM